MSEREVIMLAEDVRIVIDRGFHRWGVKEQQFFAIEDDLGNRMDEPQWHTLRNATGETRWEALANLNHDHATRRSFEDERYDNWDIPF